MAIKSILGNVPVLETKDIFPRLMRGKSTRSIYLVTGKLVLNKARCVCMKPSGNTAYKIGEVSEENWNFLEDYNGSVTLTNE